MTITKILLLLLAGFFVQSLSAQSLEWDITLGSKGNDAFHAVSRDFDGNIVLAGVNEQDDPDIYFVVMSLSGEVLQEKSIDLGGAETATCVSQARDKGYWLGGHRKSQKYTQAFLIKMDDDGSITDTLFFQSDSKLYDITADNYARFWAVGEEEGQLMLVHFNADGQILWKQVYAAKHQQRGKSIRKLSNGNLLIVLEEKSSKKEKDILLLKTDSNGQQIYAKPIASPQPINEVNDLTISRDGGCILAGSSRSHPKGMKDIWIVKADSLGNVVWQKTIEKIGKDEARTLSAGFKNEYFVAGYSQSNHRGNSRRSNMWLQSFDEEGNFLRNEIEAYYGGKQNDVALDILSAYDGGLVIAGYSASGNAIKEDAWVKYLPLYEKLAPRSATASLSAPRLLDENGNGSLDFGEHARLILKIRNTGDEDIIQLKTQISGVDYGILYPKEIPVGYLGAGEEKELTIPLEGTIGIKNEKQVFELTFSAKNELTIPGESIPVRTQKNVEPDIQFSGHAFLDAQNEKTGHFFFLNIENTGGLAAKDIQINFFHSEGIQPVSKNNIRLSKLAPQSSEVVYFEYEPIADGTPVSIQCQLFFKDFPGLIDSVFTFNPLFVRSSPSKPQIKNEDHFVWIKPTAKTFNRKIDTLFTNRSTLKAVLVSNAPLTNRQVDISVRPAKTEGSKIKRRSTPQRIHSVKTKDHYLHFIHGDLKLESGLNKIGITINRPGVPVRTEEFLLHYEQPRPNLYLLSIGIPYTNDDLKYTAKDAADFANVMSIQHNLYDSIHVTLLNTPETTTAQNIRKAVKELVDVQTTNLLRPFDVVMVFISSHGERERLENTYRDYAFKIKIDQSGGIDDIDFEVDIMEKLAQINCHRYTFVDACHSGKNIEAEGLASKDSEDEALSQVLNQLVATQPDLYSIMSCSATELSWEDQAWENGAFTKALLEVFGGEDQLVLGNKEINANRDNDKKITIEELYNYLKLRVPYLVKTDVCQRITEQTKRNCTISQTPYMPKEKSKSDLPFILLK